MKYLIVGGTGTLGQELVKQLATQPFSEITVLSRDEFKQSEMKRWTPLNVKFVIGDIRDERLIEPFWGHHVCFHVAALKHVDVLEKFPEEAIKTNILGTINVANACAHTGIQYVVFSSTDKAVDPINAYGMSKGLAEKIWLGKNKIDHISKFKVFRWGNVMGSRGSVIYHFAKTLKESGTIWFTDPNMTRFWLRVSDAVKFMLENYQDVKRNLFIPPLKAASVARVAASVARVLGFEHYLTCTLGLRPGEKMHEAIVSTHSDKTLCSNTATQLTDDELDVMVKEILCPS